MMLPRFLRSHLIALLLSAIGIHGAVAESRPNIIYILADDLGYGDVRCLNSDSKIPTPHMDRMAEEGLTFTDAHSGSAVCTPTRYGILTGRYAWRTRLKSGVLWGYSPPLIEQGRPTVASFLKDQGYRTACVGKWHLGMQWTGKDGQAIPAVPLDRRTPPRHGRDIDYSKPVTGGPLAVGFDWYYGISASLNMAPFCYIENNRPVIVPTIDSPRIKTEFISVDEGVRSPDFTITSVMPTLTGKAVRYIEEQASEHPNRPFFLYFPLTAPHLPLVPNEEFRGKSAAGEYGDFVVEVDATVGAVLDALNRAGIADNTLVIFTSDNGGLYHWWEPREADDLKYYRINRRGQYVKDRGHQGNAHLRGTKADIWEGGHRVPFIARWPGHVPAGTTSDALIELTDLIATCAAIVGANMPPKAGEDSRNILPTLLGKKTEKPVREFAIHHSLWGHFAIRQGPWKMIPRRGSGGFTRPREIEASEGEATGQLYNLEQDPSETTNLWMQQPDIVQQLQ
ncbi:MAG: arylsulfatase [Candidatus Hydrogenedentes bacterium]|nr:arylsulfatase [Candidatus Hydrogenedentota bacterium]